MIACVFKGVLGGIGGVIKNMFNNLLGKIVNGALCAIDQFVSGIFAKVFDTSSIPEGGSETEHRIDCQHNALSNIWHFKWKFSFMLFSKTTTPLFIKPPLLLYI